MRRRTLAAAALLGMLLIAGCATARADRGGESTGASAAEPSGEVTVFAAASLRTAFDEIAGLFEEQHPDIEVNPIVYDGSSTLVTQLQEGAYADVLATADERSMQVVVDAALASTPQIFATNSLVVAVPAGNPAHVTTLADLADVVTVLCAPEVPCGGAATALLKAGGVSVTPASQEQNVTAVLQKVAAGEADAGLVYATDVIGDDAVESFVPEGAEKVVNRYPVVALDGASDAGTAFVEFVRGEQAQSVLHDLGFGSP